MNSTPCRPAARPTRAARCVPSVSRSATRCRRPLARTAIRGTPPVCDVKTRRRPSGIQTGPWSSPGSVVTRVSVSRARSHTQMSFVLIVDLERDPRAVRRQPRPRIRPRGAPRDRLLPALAIHPHQRARRRAAAAAGRVHQRAVAATSNSAVPVGSVTTCGTTTRPCRASRARVEVEGNGPQRPAGDVDEVAARHVVRLARRRESRSSSVPVARSSTATCAASMPPVSAVMVNRTAVPPGKNCGHR